MNYFKIVDKKTIKIIDDLFAKREEYLQPIKVFINQNPELNYMISNSFFWGVKLMGFYVLAPYYESEAFNNKLWKRCTRGSYKEFVTIQPRKSTVALYAQWKGLMEKEEFSYQSLLETITDEDVQMILKSPPTIQYLPGYPVLVGSGDFAMNDVCVPISVEEANRLLPNQNSEHYKNILKIH